MKRAKRRDRLGLFMRNELPAIVLRALTKMIDDQMMKIVASVYGYRPLTVGDIVAQVRSDQARAVAPAP